MFSPGKSLSSVRERRRLSGRVGGCEHCQPNLVTFGVRRGRVCRCRPSPSASDPVQAVTLAPPHVAPPPDRETFPLVTHCNPPICSPQYDCDFTEPTSR